MDIEAIDGTDTTRRQDGSEFLHFARRRTDKDCIRIDAIQTIIMMIDTGELHIGSSFDGLFGSTANIAVP